MPATDFPELKDCRDTDDPAKRHWRAMKQGMAVAHWAEVAPGRTAIVSVDGSRTFAELNARANQLMRALSRRGLVPGDPVALFCTNRPEFVEAWAACLRSGWRLTPINTHLTSEEVAYIVVDCGARAFIADGELAGVAGATRDQVVAAHGDRLAASLFIAADGRDAPERFEDFETALSDQDEGDPGRPVPGSSMLYTSGTTGRPKGVYRRGQLPTADNTAAYQGGELNLVTGPLYHGGPWVVSMHTPLSNGAGIVIMRRWDAEEALRLIDAHTISHTHMVPTMFHRLLALPDDVRARYDVSSLRGVIHGAAPCPVHVKKAMIDWWGPVITEYYSATEGFGCIVSSDQWLARPGTVGRPQPDGAVMIGDDGAEPLPADTEGLVWIKAPDDGTRFLRCLRRPGRGAGVVLPRASRWVQVPPSSGVHRGAAQRRRRKGGEVGTARAVPNEPTLNCRSSISDP